MSNTEYISCIRDGLTGICRDIKDKKAWEDIEAIRTKLNEVIQLVNNLTGADVSLATKEDLEAIQHMINELNNRINNMSEFVVTKQDNSIVFAESERQRSKNLLDISKMLNNNLKVDEMGVYTLTKVGDNRFSAYVDLNIQANTTFTISVTNLGSTANILSMQFLLENGNNVSVDITSGEKIISYSYAIKKARLYINLNETDNSYRSFRNLQIELGSVASGYQEYEGAIAHMGYVNDYNKYFLNELNRLDDESGTHGANIETLNDNVSELNNNLTTLSNRAKVVKIFDTSTESVQTFSLLDNFSNYDMIMFAVYDITGKYSYTHETILVSEFKSQNGSYHYELNQSDAATTRKMRFQYVDDTHFAITENVSMRLRRIWGIKL